MCDIGCRVMRGPDWHWGDQDGSDGFLGTVVEIGKPGSLLSPDKTVVVQWDTGSRSNYRIGYESAYDLYLYDSGPCGISHPDIRCDSCGARGLSGIRWRCRQCTDYDLCTKCYMGDKHDLSHPFNRIDLQNCQPVPVGKRKDETKIRIYGLLPGAKVIRGHDWEWGDQDGGSGKIGKIVAIRDWSFGSSQSVAYVNWGSESNVYRVGHSGKVDLKLFAVGSVCVYCYKNHLPVLGKITESCPVSQPNSMQCSSPRSFSVGDRVKINLDLDSFKKLQEGHGGWNDQMIEILGVVGKVHRITVKGDIRVQYGTSNNRWTINPEALKKEDKFSVGDTVKMIDDVIKIQEYQQGHGEWIDFMKVSVGKVGQVKQVYGDGDVRVDINGQTWTMNPLCLVHSDVQMNSNLSASVNDVTQHQNSMKSWVTQINEQDTSMQTLVDQLLKMTLVCNLSSVSEILEKHPEIVDCQSYGKTPLQVASHQGYLNIVEFLVSKNASVFVPDNDGDTALHYAAYGNSPEVIEYLIQRGAPVDAVNKSCHSALHIAVNKQYLSCVKVLIKYGCDVNLQDKFGDTALNDASSAEDTEIFDLLLSLPHIDLKLKNKKGFNALHHVTLKGNAMAVEKLLQKSPDIVDIKKEDGFSALHLACLNGLRAVSEILILAGHCDVNIKNKRCQTPLILSVIQGHVNLIELLVNNGANVACVDENGNNALHIAVSKIGSFWNIIEAESPVLFKISELLKEEDIPSPVCVAVCCYLVQKRVSLHDKNKEDKSPFDILDKEHQAVLAVIQRYADGHHGDTCNMEAANADPVQMETSDSKELECVICCEGVASVVFHPCKHQLACVECCVRMKKCIKCQVTITAKITLDGMPASVAARQFCTEKLKRLETKIQEMEEVHTCQICLERRKNTAFLCGHAACHVCAKTLRICHMCRKPITKTISLY